jgi:magnesium chelatase family protein
MLARRLTTILPAMTLAEALEDHPHPQRRRPHGRPHGVGHDPPVSRAPPDHLGRGADLRRHVPMPGEVSRAHHGSSCLDELAGFRRHVLEVLRQPLEEGVV